MSMRDQFDELNNAFAGATEAGDAEAISWLFTEDAMLLAPGFPPASGREAIRAIHERDFEESDGGYNLIIKTLDFEDLGDIAYAAGTWEAEDERGNWLDVVRRQEDGALLYQKVCWNEI